MVVIVPSSVTMTSTVIMLFATTVVHGSMALPPIVPSERQAG
jgi:hypothetical protein